MTATISTPCGDLSQLCDDHPDKPYGALDAFAAVHLCICQEVELQGREELVQLNAEFTKTFVIAYNRYSQKQFNESLHPSWLNAYKRLKKDPTAHISVMVLLAKAHIFADLRRVLACLEVKYEAYDSVADQIDHCLNKVGFGYTGENLSEKVWIAVGRVGHPPVILTVRYVRRLVYHWAQKDKLRLFNGLTSEDREARQRRMLSDEAYYFDCLKQ